MEYRREIDGLRALAVLPVILFHAGFQTFSGGFVGVDVFFVISGYLITSIILAELEQGKFSIINFYERRARRILPAMFLVMAICIPFAWILLSREDLWSFSRSLVAVALFVSNIFFWRDGGYFETVAELKPLLHTWSLAVEEQYYVIFPIFLMFSWKFGRRWIVGLLLLIAVISLFAAQWGISNKPVATFFLLPTRAWELAIGAMTAFYSVSNCKVSISKTTEQGLSVIGFSLITFSIFAFDKNTPFPGIYALAPTVGAALVILFAYRESLVGSILGSKAFVGIGLISYSAYLWHQPLISFSRIAYGNQGIATMSSACLMALILAFFSWKFVEQPFRDRKRFSRTTVFTFSAVGSVAMIAVGLVSASLFGSNSTYGGESKLAMALVNNSAVYASNMDERKFVKFRIKYETLTPNVVIIGSSRIMQIGDHNFGDKVLNVAVSGSSVEDDIAILGLATTKFNPKVLLIGVDPWLFNSESGQNRWKSLDTEFNHAISLIKSVDSNVVSQSGTFFQQDSSANSLYKMLNGIYDNVNRSKIYAADDVPDIRDKIRRDGSRVYNTVYSSKSRIEVEQGFGDLLNYAMENYKFSQIAKENFESSIIHYRKKYNIALVLSPYHPKLYDLMKNRKPIYLDVEQQFRNLASALDVSIIGSYDPRKVGCTEDDFYDGMHPKDVCMERLLSEFKH